MATTVFRVKKKDNFTTISNYHLQDKALSNKAKGLLTIMLSLPPNWDMTLKGLTSLSSDGIDAIRSTLSELEENGYLSRSRSRNSQGQLQCTEYTIRELPETPQENGMKETMPEAVTDTADSAPVNQMGKSDVVQMGFPYVGKTYVGKSDPIKYLTNKDTYSINNYLSNPHHKNSKNNKDEIDEKVKAEILSSERKRAEEILKANIEYDILTDTSDEEYKSFIDLALNIMLDAVTTTRPLVTVKGQEFPAETVRSRLFKITAEQIDYVWHCLNESNKKISKMQNYILTALYNSTFGEDLYFTQRVKEDMALPPKNV